MRDPDQVYRSYQDLESYVDWTGEDAERVRSLAPLLEPHFPALVEAFYTEIARHAETQKVFTGGQDQVDRLKGSLLAWLRDLLTGPYDRACVLRRWRDGVRHVEIGLDQVYTNTALSRLRDGLVRLLGESWTADLPSLVAVIRSLKLITGHRVEMEPTVERMLASGVDAVCYKPFDVPALLGIVKKLAIG